MIEYDFQALEEAMNVTSFNNTFLDLLYEQEQMAKLVPIDEE